MEMSNLTNIGLTLMLVILAIMLIPLIIGVLVALLFDASGVIFYGIIISISFLLWCILGLMWWL